MQVLGRQDGTEKTIDILRPGEPVGDLQLLTGGRRTATVRASEPSLLVRLARPTFEAASGESPDLVTEMAELIRRRLEHYRGLQSRPWSWRCRWRADRILLLCDGEGSSEAGVLERTLLGDGSHMPTPLDRRAAP